MKVCCPLRFLAVHSQCHPGAETCSHVAFVSALKSGKIYKVDLGTQKSEVLQLVTIKAVLVLIAAQNVDPSYSF